MSKLDETIQWYNQHVTHYAAQADKYQPKAQLNDFFRHLKPGDIVLDAGCGSGRDSHLLHQLGLTSIGLDLSQGLLRYAKNHAPNLEFVSGNLLHLPFPVHTFHGIWSHASLVHLETKTDVQTVFKEFERVLKPGGVIHIHVKANTYGKDFDTLIDKRVHTERHFRFYTQAEITQLATDQGFQTIKFYQTLDKNSKEKYSQPVEWITYLGKKTDESIV